MNQKKRKLPIISSVIIIIIIVAFVGKIYMNHQAEQNAKQEEFLKNLSESKEQVKELLNWNFDDVQSVTFDYEAPKEDYYPVKIDKSLSTTPAGGLIINGYINDDHSLTFSCGVNSSTGKKSEDGGLSFGSEDKIIKNHLKIRNTDYLEKAWTTFGGENVWSVMLNLSDIRKLKKQGFSSNISSEQIIEYLEGKNGSTK
ncbi:DUF1310 family protein [Lactovum odontotermitis]